jgi:hypothetical protein
MIVRFFVANPVGKIVTLTLTVPWAQLNGLGEVYAVLRTNSKQKFVKVSIKAEGK